MGRTRRRYNGIHCAYHEAAARNGESQWWYPFRPYYRGPREVSKCESKWVRGNECSLSAPSNVRSSTHHHALLGKKGPEVDPYVQNAMPSARKGMLVYYEGQRS
jgi:hypothetical protein